MAFQMNQPADTVLSIALAIEALYAAEDAIQSEQQQAIDAVADQRYALEDRLGVTSARNWDEFRRKAELLVRSSEHQTEMLRTWSDGLIADAVRIFKEVRP